MMTSLLIPFAALALTLGLLAGLYYRSTRQQAAVAKARRMIGRSS